MKSSITKRWVRGSLFFTLAVVLVAEALFLYFTITGYYQDARQVVQNQIYTLNDQLTMPASATADERSQRLIGTVEQFEAKSQFELMLVNADGGIEATSSGLMPQYTEVEPDILEALRGTSGVGQQVFRTVNGEKVLATTVRTPYTARGVEAMRLVTSLTQVDAAIRNIVLASVALLAAIVLASVISGIYFIRSIVYPLRKVEASAAAIAEGDFEIRIENTSSDEVGSLVQTINHMAVELGKSERMKNDFISSVSHELRTPLTSIKGWAETVGRLNDPQNPNFRRGIDIITSETDRLYDMVEELLDFSRMQNGLTLSCELLDLAAEVEEAVLLNTQRAAELGVALLYTAPQLPVPVMADRNRIRQVMVNVLDNAIKYSYTGGEVNVVLVQHDDEVLVQVEDEGQGISPEDIENVKIRFYKGKGAVRGSGIGLAVVDEIMQAHGGGIEVVSELQRGSTITLRLPLYSGKKAAEVKTDKE